MSKSQVEPAPGPQATAAPRARSDSRLLLGLGAALFVLIALAYSPASQCAFLNWDDEANFVQNDHFTGLSRAHLSWAWSTRLLGVYQPVGWMAYELEYVLLSRDPARWHLVSVGLHACNGVLLFLLARAVLIALCPVAAAARPRTLSWAAWLGAAAFALHPLRVEPVCWLSAQSYLLCALFCQLSLLAFLRSLQTAGRRTAFCWRGAALVLFALAVLSKSAAVCLPLVLLAVELHLRPVPGCSGAKGTLRRLGPALAGLLPFIVVSLVGALCAMGARLDVVPLAEDGLPARIELLCHSLVFYLSKSVAPVGLCHLIPAPEPMVVFSAERLLPVLLTLAAAAACWRLRRAWPLLVTAVLSYVLLLLPASGLVRSGAQVVADRYSYLPMLPLSIAAAGGLWLLFHRRPRLRSVVTPAVVGVLLCFTLLSRARVGVWRDSESLWTDALQPGGPAEARAAYQLGRTRMNEGRYEEARALAERALARTPDYPEAEACLGIVYFRLGQYEKAERLLNHAVEAAPQEIDAACSLALLWAQRGRQQDALQCMERLRRTQPDQAHVYRTLGILQGWRGQAVDAIQSYRTALRLDPRDYAVHHNLGQLLVGRGQLEEGLSQLQEAVRLRPQVADLHYAVGRTLVLTGREEEACAAFARTLDLCPDHARALRERAAVLERLGRRGASLAPISAPGSPGL